jgi:hypothetical protein
MSQRVECVSNAAGGDVLRGHTGGDGFSTLTVGTNQVTAPGFDIDALIAWELSPRGPRQVDRLDAHSARQLAAQDI